MATDYQSIAQVLRDSHRRRESFRPLANSGSMEEAYAIQDEFQRLLIADGAGGIVGYKVALTSPAMQAFVGLDHPCAGAVFANRVLQSPQRMDLANFQNLGVECEFAVRLAKDLPARPGGHSSATVAPAVAAVMPFPKRPCPAPKGSVPPRPRMLTTMFMLFSSRPDRRLISIQPALVTMSLLFVE